MKTRTVVLASVAALVIAGGGVAAGAAMFGGDESPTVAATTTATTATETSAPLPSSAPATTATEEAPSPVETTSKPTATVPPTPAVLDGAVEKQLFSWLTSPIPTTWTGRGGDADSHTYAETNSCTTGEKSCPQVEFLSLTSGANRVNYGPNPINQWAKNVCPARSSESVVTLDPIVVDGVTVQSYKLPCQGMEYWAWLIPGKLLVMTGDADGGTAAPATVTAVLGHSDFN